MAVAEENKKREDKRQAAAAGKKQFERKCLTLSRI